MGWIETEVRFPGRARIFVVGRQAAVNNGFHEKAMRSLADISDPERLELFMRALVVMVRPELADCQLTFMNFDYAKSEWQIGVGHPSLPVVASGEFIEREPLFKESPAPSLP